MNDAGPRGGAKDRALALMLPGDAEIAARPERDRGYLDLLDEKLASTGAGQDLMLTRSVPMIYERWWRPALGRLFKGLTGPGMSEEIRIARLMLGLSPGDAVLDVACGPGNFSREFARAVADQGLVVGLDASETMLARGASELERSGVRNLALVRASASRLPFRDATFDGACCFAALHLFEDPLAAVDEMRRVLKPGGRIAIMTSIRRQVTLPVLKPVIQRASGLRIFEPSEVVDALRDRGFGEIRQRIAGMIQFVGGRLK